MKKREFYLEVLVKPFWQLHLITSVVSVATSLMASYEQKALLDLFKNESSNGLQRSTLVYIAVYTGLVGVRYGMLSLMRHQMYQSLVMFLFNRVCMQKLEYWDRYLSKADLLKCILADSEEFVNYLMKIFAVVTRVSLTILIVAYLLAKENFAYLVLGVVLCIARSLVLERIASYWEDYVDKVKLARSITENRMTEFINNNTQMQLYGLKRMYRYLAHETATQYSDYAKQEAFWYAVFHLSFGFIQKLVEVGLYLLFIVEKERRSFYEAQLIMAYFRLLTESIQNFADIPKFRIRARDSIDRIIKYCCNEELSLIDGVQGIDQQLADYDVEFKHVTFKYPNRDDYIFKDFSYTLAFKQKVILKGQSGRGKTTLIKLLLGLYTPENGHVTIGGTDTTTLSSDIIQQLVSILPQEPFVLEDRSVKENLELFCIHQTITDEQIRDALTRVKLESLIPLLDQKLQSLSGGQKQRLGLARCILNDSPIIVLDEPFSALDHKLKQDLQRLVETFTRDKTVIMISHDDQWTPSGWNIWNLADVIAE